MNQKMCMCIIRMFLNTGRYGRMKYNLFFNKQNPNYYIKDISFDHHYDHHHHWANLRITFPGT